MFVRRRSRNSVKLLVWFLFQQPQAISLTRLNVQQLIFGILYEESSVGPKALGNGNDAEYGSDLFWFLGMRDLGGTDFREFPNRSMVVLFQPLRYFGIVALLPSQFDDCDNRVGIPVSYAALSMNPHEMWYGCVRCLAHVSLMVKLFPKFMPRRLAVLLTLKFRKQWSGITLDSVTACQVIPAIVI